MPASVNVTHIYTYTMKSNVLKQNGIELLDGIEIYLGCQVWRQLLKKEKHVSIPTVSGSALSESPNNNYELETHDRPYGDVCRGNANVIGLANQK